MKTHTLLYFSFARFSSLRLKLFSLDETVRNDKNKTKGRGRNRMICKIDDLVFWIWILINVIVNGFSENTDTSSQNDAFEASQWQKDDR